MRAAVLLLVLVGCEARLGPGGAGGLDDVDDVSPDAAVQSVDAAAPEPDAAPMIVDNECGIAANQGDLGTMSGTAGAEAQSSTTTAQIYSLAAPTSLTAMQPMPDVIVVELWDGYGVFSGGAARTGTFTLTGDETDYDTCGVCVLMGANVRDNTPARLLLATAGTVTVTSIATAAGQTTEVTVADASFVEIEDVPDQGYQTVTSSMCSSPIERGALRGTR